jgi:hypothetical protein
MAAGAVVEVSGLRELVRAFQKFDKDLTSDLVNELAEAANPVRVATQEKVVRMQGVGGQRNAGYWSAMRIGVSRAMGTVYVAPQWRSNKGTPQGGVFKGAIWRRMEAAVDEKAGDVEKRMGDWLDTLADDWGSHLAA